MHLRRPSRDRFVGGRKLNHGSPRRLAIDLQHREIVPGRLLFLAESRRVREEHTADKFKDANQRSDASFQTRRMRDCVQTDLLYLAVGAPVDRPPQVPP